MKKHLIFAFISVIVLQSCQYQLNFPDFDESQSSDASSVISEEVDSEIILKSIAVNNYEQKIESNVFDFELDAYELLLTYSDLSTEVLPINFSMITSFDHFKLYEPGDHTITIYYENLFTKIEVLLFFDEITTSLFNIYSLHFAPATEGTNFRRFHDWRRTLVKDESNPITNVHLSSNGYLFITYFDGNTVNVGKAFDANESFEGQFIIKDGKFFWRQTNTFNELYVSDVPENLKSDILTIDDINISLVDRMFYYALTSEGVEIRNPLISLDAIITQGMTTTVMVDAINVVDQSTEEQTVSIEFSDDTSVEFVVDIDLLVTMDLMTISDDGFWVFNQLTTSKKAKEALGPYALFVENKMLKISFLGNEDELPKPLMYLEDLSKDVEFYDFDRLGLYSNQFESRKLLIDAGSFFNHGLDSRLRIEDFKLQIQLEDSSWFSIMNLKDFLEVDAFTRYEIRIEDQFIQTKTIESSNWYDIIPLNIFIPQGSSNAVLTIQGQTLGITLDGTWQEVIDLYHFNLGTEAGFYFIENERLQWKGQQSSQVKQILDLTSIFLGSSKQHFDIVVNESLTLVPNGGQPIDFVSMNFFNPNQDEIMISNGFIQLSNQEDLTPIIELKSLIKQSQSAIDLRQIQYQVEQGFVQWRSLGQTSWQSLIDVEILSGFADRPNYFTYLIENPSYFANYNQWLSDLESNFIINQEETFSIRFVVDGIQKETYDQLQWGSQVELPTPTKEGHTFLGWYLSESVHAQQFTLSTEVKANHTLYAKWAVNRYKIEYFHDNEVIFTDYYYYGEIVTYRPGIIKSGYGFSHWSIQEGSSNTLPRTLNSNLKLYSNFITYDAISKVGLLTANIKLGDSMTFPDTIPAVTEDNRNIQVPVIWDRKTIQLSTPGAYVFFGTVNGYNGLAIFRLHVTDLKLIDNLVSGYIHGLESDHTATLILSNRSVAFFTTTDRWGYYEFSNIPTGQYKLKVELQGYQITEPFDVVIEPKIRLSINPLTRGPFFQIPQTTAIQHTLSIVEKFNLNHFFYEWRYGGDYFGYETTSNIVPPTVITFLNEDLVINDNSASITLKDKYNVVLSDTGLKWTVEYANRVLDMLKRSPVPGNHPLYQQLSKWVLVDYYLPKDVTYTVVDGHYEIYLSVVAFQNATPRMAEIEGKKGILFSNRLYNAMIRLLTDEGKNVQMVQHILQQRFGVSLFPNYTEITRITTGENEHRFQPFESEELLHILNMFEEMPQGLHKVEGLKYLVRRLNGLSHPLYPQAAAVAWPFEGANYIEFMEVAFSTPSLFDTYRLIVHEKAHFLWEFTIKESLKNEWIELGGWYQTEDTASGWASSKTTEFVSAYSHGINPNEDMAESIAFYLLNPSVLKAHAIDKFYFIQNYIMSGTTYLAQFREDLTFEVFNLFPDYDYPGKINRLEVNIYGAPEEDKQVTIEIDLNHIEGLQDGANAAIIRVYSSFLTKEGNPSSTYFDLWLTPVDGNKHHLKGYITLSKFLKSGYWRTDQIVVFDQNGGSRFEGAHQFGFKFYLDNPLEDIEKPVYVKESAKMELETEVIDGRNFYRVTVSFEVIEENLKSFNGAYARISHSNPTYYSLQSWGFCNVETLICEASFLLSDYYPSGTYELREIIIVDLAGNDLRVRFSHSETDEYVSIEVPTLLEDLFAPELDLNKITISAVPTNPSAPNGETRVTITYYVRDNKSGLGLVFLRLLGPQGEGFADYHYHENFYTLYFNGEPTAWTKYEMILILPAGSSPGLWGLSEITLYDKAGNFIKYNFLEIVTFQIIN
jgi:uncharacterized repeat protein (TIGR02543 family)